MNFKELLGKADIENVLSLLESHYKCSANNMEGFRLLIPSLLKRTPVPSDCRISITHVEECGEGYEHVCGIEPGAEITKALCLVPHAEWLGMELTKETLEQYPTDEIAAHCLWEMTFFGFTDESIRDAEAKIFRSEDNAVCHEFREEDLVPLEMND